MMAKVSQLGSIVYQQKEMIHLLLINIKQNNRFIKKIRIFKNFNYEK